MSAFAYCRSLESIDIPEGVTSISGYAFYSCEKLTSINIPEGVTSIGEYEFGSCSSMISITIPYSVTSIAENAFNSHNSDLCIYGYTGSAAESYAKEKKIKFVAIDSATPVVTTAPVTTTKVSETTTPVTTTKVIETTTPVTTTKVTETTTPGNKDVLKGDLDRNGKISLSDLIRFKLVMMSSEKEPDLSVMDMNDDGVLNILDYIYFLELFNNVDQ